jgi:NAD(P)H-nitrite reductase large subunit
MPTPTPPTDSVPITYPVCACFQVSEEVIERAIRKLNLRTVEEVMRHTSAGCGCHTCHPELVEILERCAKGEFKFPLEPQDKPVVS